MRTKRSKGRWIDELWDGVGRFVNLETTDGVVRYGRMTGLRTRVIGFNGIEEDVVTEIELNNDAMDSIPLNTLAKIQID